MGKELKFIDCRSIQKLPDKQCIHLQIAAKSILLMQIKIKHL